MSQSDVRLRGIVKNYGKADVIHGIDLDIEPGEFTVFVGPSGCGKTTLLRMIAGLEDISGGDLNIGGVRVNELGPSERGVAMVFQSYALYPHKTVYDNMAFALKIAKTPKAEIERRVREASEILQLTEYLDRLPKALSGGQRQRVAIGRAIVREPKLFLFDEPLSNLDAELRVTMRIELSRLHKELGTTMIYVTHDQVEAMTMGDRIAVFHQGRIAQLGEPMDLYQQPKNEFVAGFIGSPRMNFLGMAVVAVEGRQVHLKLEKRGAVAVIRAFDVGRGRERGRWRGLRRGGVDAAAAWCGLGHELGAVEKRTERRRVSTGLGHHDFVDGRAEIRLGKDHAGARASGSQASA